MCRFTRCASFVSKLSLGLLLVNVNQHRLKSDNTLKGASLKLCSIIEELHTKCSDAIMIVEMLSHMPTKKHHVKSIQQLHPSYINPLSLYVKPIDGCVKPMKQLVKSYQALSHYRWTRQVDLAVRSQKLHRSFVWSLEKIPPLFVFSLFPF